MVNVRDIYNFLDELAPFETAMDFDNVGILVGDANQEVTKVLVALDITNEVIKEAKAMGAQLIISHHPVIFNGIKRLDSCNAVFNLARSGISAICAHTNLDAAKCGVNTCFAAVLGLTNLIPLSIYEARGKKYTLGFVGTLNKTMSPAEFARFVKEALGCSGLRYTDVKEGIKRVAICSGSSGNLIGDAVEARADAYVTGEIKHHEILFANENNICIVDAGHFKTEDIVITPLVDLLKLKFEQVEFFKSGTCTDHIKYI